jgi:nucleoside-diphosphate-sugar epimerase
MAAGQGQSVRIAVIGADGFIGRHIVDTLSQDPAWQVRAIARTPPLESAPLRAPVERRLADARNTRALEAALENIEIVVHAAAGDPATIRRTVVPVYRAAERNRCRRIVYLGTAVVHGQAPVEGTREDTPLPRGQRLPYNRAKRWAERKLLALARRGAVEVTVLRPGIVYGPRSRWITDAADALLAGRAGLVDGGGGLCNALHVANLVHAVRLAARVPAAAGEAFLLGEDESITWREFYRRIAEPLGIDADTIRLLRVDERRLRSAERRADCLAFVHRIVPVRKLLRAILAPWRARAGHGDRDAASGPNPAVPPTDLETALLHRARYLPDWSKSRALLGYRPVVAPAEAWGSTIDWLASAGYPVTPHRTVPVRFATSDAAGPHPGEAGRR